MQSRAHFPLAAVLWLLTVTAAPACTIPVFRYALERWQADRLLVIVYYRGALATGDQSAIDNLAARSTLAGGPLNIEVVRFDLGAPPAFLQDIEPPTGRPLPWIEIRSRAARPTPTVRWQGTLNEALAQTANVFDSPARQELIRRLLDGDSAVWLVVAPKGQEENIAATLQAKLDAVKPELVLPAGVGTPGSELYAAIPLEIRFSVLAIAHDDPAEKALVAHLASAVKDWRSDAAYVVPVFGRLRALEVIPEAEVDDFVVRDIGEFLCGACSCRVKEANPGFDLVASTDWHERLFGDGEAPPLDAEQPPLSAAAPLLVPQYVAIPPGTLDSKADKPAELALKTARVPTAPLLATPLPAASLPAALPPAARGQDSSYILVALMALVACGALAVAFATHRR